MNIYDLVKHVLQSIFGKIVSDFQSLPTLTFLICEKQSSKNAYGSTFY